MKYGNHTVVVRWYEREIDKQSKAVWTREHTAATFIIGGVNGQAMSANDVTSEVLHLMRYAPTDVNLFINGAQATDHGSDTDVYMDLSYVGPLVQE